MEVDSVIPSIHMIPEIEMYCYLLVIIFLIDHKKYNHVYKAFAFSCFLLEFITFSLLYNKYDVLCFFQAKACCSVAIAQLKNLDKGRTVDVLTSRIYFYYSYCYELTGNLAEIRG